MIALFAIEYPTSDGHESRLLYPSERQSQFRLALDSRRAGSQERPL